MESCVVNNATIGGIMELPLIHMISQILCIYCTVYRIVRIQVRDFREYIRIY